MQRFGSITYAQHGDDLMILNLFNLMGIQYPNYMDIGAHHPSEISNTKLLYDRGWRGLNVEVNPNLMEAFDRERPNDVNVNIGVGAEPDIIDFYMHNPVAGRNTCDPVERDKLIAEGHPVWMTIQVRIVTLNMLVDTYFGNLWPDLLTIDIEGFDYKALSATNFSHHNSPLVICVETRPSDTDKMISLLKAKGYFAYCRMGENLFFVRNDKRKIVIYGQ